MRLEFDINILVVPGFSAGGHIPTCSFGIEIQRVKVHQLLVLNEFYQLKNWSSNSWTSESSIFQKKGSTDDSESTKWITKSTYFFIYFDTVSKTYGESKGIPIKPNM